MLFISIVLTALTFITVMLVSGNNLSACVGPAIGSRILNKNFGILIGAVGFTLGLLIQGTVMKNFVNMLVPNVTPELQVGALLVTIVIFVIADIIRVPLSYSMSLAGLLAGLSIAGGILTNQVFLIEVIAMWIIAPLASIVFVFFVLKIFHMNISKDFWKRLKIYKLLTIILSFTSAYVLGANTLGLILATGGVNLINIIVAIFAIFIGSFFFSAGEIKRISKEFFLMRYPNAIVTLLSSTVLVEIGTFLNVPLSNTQTLAAAVFGAGISYKTRFMSLKPFLIIILGWIIAPIISFALGLIIG